MASALEQLLLVQEHDTHLDQLQHRRSTLEVRDQIKEGEVARAALTRRIEEASARREELRRELRRFEDEAQLVEDKAGAEDARLYSGDVTAMKELQALQDEIASLKRRQGDLEDRALGVMESIEPITADIEDLEAQRGEAEARLESRRGQLVEQEAEIEAEIAGVSVERDRTAAGVAADMLEQYAALRAQLGGVAVARLNGTTCDGCHLTLSAVEVDRLKKEPADAVVPCGECGRILVR